MQLIDKITRVEQKIQQLALKLERLERENNTLFEENRQLRHQLDTAEKQHSKLTLHTAELQDRLDRQHSDAPRDVQQLRKEIDHYIEEIDKCVAWLYDG